MMLPIMIEVMNKGDKAVTEDLDSFENRYRSPKYVEFWMADQGLEGRRIQWRKRLVASLPFGSSDTIRILDIGAGTGGLSLEMLYSFPNALVTSQDFSEAMLSHARKQLAGFEERVTFVQSDLQTSWLGKEHRGDLRRNRRFFCDTYCPQQRKGHIYRAFRVG